MRFISDNAARVCPEVMAAVAAANEVDAAYDGDRFSARLDEAFSALFETDVAVLWVATGTAANSLALAALCPPFGAILCHRDAHIRNDECGAPGFYTHGAALLALDGEGGKLAPEAVASAIDAIRPDVHRTHPHAISITNATEYGRVYTPAETAALGATAKDRGLGFHVDGARFANVVAHLGCAPADLTWRAGVDALSFGFVKNGGMSAEALVFFRRDLIDDSRYRRKRAGHLQSKGRFLAAQLLAMIEDDLWLTNARAANAGAAALADAAGERLLHRVEANELFLRLSPARGPEPARSGLRLLRLGRQRRPAGHVLGSAGKRGGGARQELSPLCDQNRQETSFAARYRALDRGMTDVQPAGALPNAAPPVIRRSDYKPPDWLVPEIALDFQLDPACTMVRTILQVRRNGEHRRALRLDGDGLTPSEIWVDGQPSAWKMDDGQLVIRLSGNEHRIETIVAIAPETNTALMGLYSSSGLLCTQCEAQGFRRITFFPDRPDVLSRYSVRMEADAARYPVLLSNGNCVDSGKVDNNRHWAHWQDPFPQALLSVRDGRGRSRLQRGQLHHPVGARCRTRDLGAGTGPRQDRPCDGGAEGGDGLGRTRLRPRI